MCANAFSQVKLGSTQPDFALDYRNPDEYIIGGIEVSGVEFLDPNTLKSIIGLKEGDKIKVPGDKIKNSIEKLWDQGILGDINVKATKVEGEYIYLKYELKERPRLSKFIFFGVKSGEEKDLKNKINLVRGKVLTRALMKNTKKKIKDYFTEEGYLNTEVNMKKARDTMLSNSVILRIEVDKKERVKIEDINFIGNEVFSDGKLRRTMDDTKEKSFWRFFNTSKFIREKYEKDKEKLISLYNNEGYRDAEIVRDSVYPVNEKRIKIDMKIREGNKYYFRNISWSGNYIYSDKKLSEVLGIDKGDPYNKKLLNKRLEYNPEGKDIKSLYLDNGYLFMNVNPKEVRIKDDSIDIEMQVYEGQQATIDEVSISGNTKTSDHVVLREIRTLPGQKFDRSKLIRSQREISQLGYFDPEKINVKPMPDPEDGTVDIEYEVVEKPSDQIQLSGGWGGAFRFVGTVGIQFNNFSMRNITDLSKWSPLPAGDGQKLNLRVQANGPSFQTYSLSFTEPWLGGRKPNSFTVSMSHSINRRGIARGGGSLFNARSYRSNPNAGKLSITDLSVSLGRRLRWPDDYFTMNHTLSYQFYELNQYSGYGLDFENGTGISNSISFKTKIARNSIFNPTFPRRGSKISLSVNATPPYSLFKQAYVTYSELSNRQKFKWVEFHKWMFDASWFMELPGNFVINTKAHLGFIGNYTSDKGYTPFERFRMGGSGLTGFNFLLGSEIIGLRGYEDNDVGPDLGSSPGGVAYNKFVFELRYPVSLNPMATIFVLGFAEGGNNWDASFDNQWNNAEDFNPFKLYRSVGIGARIFMPAFGMVGVDYGWALDANEVTRNDGSLAPVPSRFTFTIGQQIR